MKIEIRKHDGRKYYGNVKVGDVFAFTENMGSILKGNKYLMCDEIVLDLQSYFTYSSDEGFPERFAESMVTHNEIDEDEFDFVVDTFCDREVIIFDATLVLEVDK